MNLVGRVVSEKMHFHKTMTEIAKDSLKTFQIEKYIVSKEEKENKESLRKRIRQNCEKRAQKAEEKHFKEPNNVEPIYIYTSEIAHHKAENSK